MARAPVIETKRLILEPLGIAHLSSRYVDWMNDKDVNAFLQSGGDYTFDKMRNYLEEQEKRQIFFWAILVKGLNKHIGNIKIDPINEKEASGEYGILIGDKVEWGKGYAKEASLAVIDYCFSSLKLKQVSLGVVEDNTGAVNLYKKMGFKTVQLISNAGIYKNKVCNTLRMVLKYAE